MFLRKQFVGIVFNLIAGLLLLTACPFQLNKLTNSIQSGKSLSKACFANLFEYVHTTLTSLCFTVIMTQLQGAMMALIGVFHEHAGKDQALNKAELKGLLETEFGGALGVRLTSTVHKCLFQINLEDLEILRCTRLREQLDRIRYLCPQKE